MPDSTVRAELSEELLVRCSANLPSTQITLTRIAEEAVRAQEALPSPDPATLVRHLLTLGNFEHYQARLDEARRHYERAVAIARAQIGDPSEDLGYALQKLSSVLGDQKQDRKALAAADESLAVREAVSPPDPSGVVLALNARARLWQQLGELRKARRDWEQALELTRRLPAGGDDELLRARIENNLGDIDFDSGDLEGARRHLEEARRIRAGETGSGKPVRQLASTLLTLASLDHVAGDFPSAIETYEQAIDGHRCWVGQDSFRFAEALSGFATVLEEAGRWDDARRRHEEALSIRQADVDRAVARGENAHRLRLLLARTLSRLGELEHRLGEASARRTLEKALEMQESELEGRPSVDLAETLFALSRLEVDEGHLPSGRRLAQQVVAILEETAPDHPLRIDALGEIALLAEDAELGLGQIDGVLRLASRSLGHDNPRVAALLLAEARLARRAGRDAAAATAALSAHAISAAAVAEVARALPESHALAFAAQRRESLDLALSLLREPLPAETVARIWEAVIASRCLVLDSELARQSLARASADPVVGDSARRLRAAREQLASLLVRSLRDPSIRPVELAQARRRALDAETAYARSTRGLLAQADPAPRPPALRKIAQALPDGGALLSFVRFRDAETGADAYQAFVLTKALPGKPAALFLGPAAPLDALVARWRDLVQASASGGDAADRAARAAGDDLRRRLWDPVVDQLRASRTVLLVPDGSLHLVNPAALPIGSDRYLVEERWAFQALTSERDVSTEKAPDPTGHGLLAVGGIDYQSAGSPPSRAIAAPQRGAGEDPRSRECRAALPYFLELPATTAEVSELARIWERVPENQAAEPEILAGDRATEASVAAAVVGKRIVHFATHAFFEGPDCGPAAPARGTRGSGRPNAEEAAGQEVLAGLALAGANRPASGLATDDGVLLTEEVVDLDLRGVEWAVLSACDTGLGVAVGGEGVFGLRRAFRLAGARTVIMSLWPVEDAPTREWMRRLYEARLLEGEDSVAAVKTASLFLLDQRRRQKESTSPVFWAAFIGSGDWR